MGLERAVNKQEWTLAVVYGEYLCITFLQCPLVTSVTGDILGSPSVTRLFQFGKLENTVAWDLMNLFISGSGSESYPLLSRGPPLLFSRCE